MEYRYLKSILVKTWKTNVTNLKKDSKENINGQKVKKHEFDYWSLHRFNTSYLVVQIYTFSCSGERGKRITSSKPAWAIEKTQIKPGQQSETVWKQKARCRRWELQFSGWVLAWDEQALLYWIFSATKINTHLDYLKSLIMKVNNGGGLQNICNHMGSFVNKRKQNKKLFNI